MTRLLTAQEVLEWANSPALPGQWAEEYRGSGRLTGRRSDTPTRMDTGDVAPGWRYVGDMSDAEFYAQFEREQHDACHRPGWADFACPYCQEAGWID